MNGKPKSKLKIIPVSFVCLMTMGIAGCATAADYQPVVFQGTDGGTVNVQKYDGDLAWCRAIGEKTLPAGSGTEGLRSAVVGGIGGGAGGVLFDDPLRGAIVGIISGLAAGIAIEQRERVEVQVSVIRTCMQKLGWSLLY
jgi:hypothetical protein